ncbi:UNVERIFIED_CONTAM: FGFR1 oncoprotein partner [Siphonaria sp. JEL0065]|nr:FGFR1 oncoprotein partner [Siphonaria sp. JEL0065]
MASELKTLVADVLQKNGTLGKIKAELRASVYNVLQDVDNSKLDTKANESKKTQFTSKDESIGIALVKDFLEFYNLGFTLSVLDPESNQSKDDAMNRNALVRELDLGDSKGKPLLLQLLESRVSGRSSGPQGQLYSGLKSSEVDVQLKQLGAIGLNEPDDELTGSDFNTSERTISRSTSSGGLDVLESI